MTKAVKSPLKPIEVVSIYVSFKNSQVHIENGVEVDTCDDVLQIHDDEGRLIALFREWDFVRIEYEEVKAL